MDLEQAPLVAAALTLIMGSLAVILWLNGRGRHLSDELEKRHPEDFEEWGRPRPGLFLSTARSRFNEVLLQRRFEKLDDPALVESFESLRRHTVIALVTTTLLMVIAAAAIFWATSSS